MRKTTFAIAALAMLAAAGTANARPSTTNMSCSQAQNLVRSKGAVVLSTGRHTYARFVRSGAYCMAAEYPVYKYAPTRDRKQCLVGYVCSANVTIDDNSLFRE